MRLYSAPMATFPRYAIYYVAAPGTDIDRFGAQLLGYDAYTGENVPFPDGIMQIAPDWRDLTKEPRKYGFHATLKAPLSLAPGKPSLSFLQPAKPLPASPGQFRSLRLWSVRSAALSPWCLLRSRPNLSGLPRIVHANSIHFARRSPPRIARGAIPLT